MKKFFKKAFVVLGIMGMGFGTVGCSESVAELLQTLLPVVLQIATGMQNNSKADPVVYEGTLNVTSYTCENNQYDPDSKVSTTASVEATLNVSEADSVVTITLKSFKVGDNTISDFTFNTNYVNGTIGDGNEAYYTGGTCTLNGSANTEVSAACFAGKKIDNKLEISFFDFYVGNKKYEGRFSGSIASQEQGNKGLAQ